MFRHSLVCRLSERAIVGCAVVCPLTDSLSCGKFLLPVHAAGRKTSVKKVSGINGTLDYLSIDTVFCGKCHCAVGF